MSLFFDQLIGKSLDFFWGVLSRIPPIKCFQRSGRLKETLDKHKFFFQPAPSYIYSVHAFCAANDQIAARALTVGSNIETLARLKPTLSSEEWRARQQELRRIIREVNQIVRIAGWEPINLDCIKIYGQLQPQLNEFFCEIEEIAEERFTRFPEDVRGWDCGKQ